MPALCFQNDYNFGVKTSRGGLARVGRGARPVPAGKRRVVQVRGTKAARSKREVPLTTAAIASLDSVPPRIDSVYVFASIRGGPFDLRNFRNRIWSTAVDTAGIAKPARLYDLRSTFTSNALAAGITTFELVRIMGTSVGMIEAHYSAPIDTAYDGILARLEGFWA